MAIISLVMVFTAIIVNRASHEIKESEALCNFHQKFDEVQKVFCLECR